MLAARNAGGACEGLDHDSFKRALPQFADDEAGQEVFLVRLRSCEEFSDQLGPCFGGTRPGDGGNAIKQGVGFGESQRLWGLGLAGSRIANGGISDSNFSLAQAAGEIADGNRDLVGLSKSNAHMPLAIARYDQRTETEMFSAFQHFRDTVDGNELIV